MTATQTNIQREFHKSRERGDLADWVRIARPAARRAILDGLDSDPIGIIKTLAGEPERTTAAAGVTWEGFCNGAVAALALGICIGQMLNASVFDKEDK